MVCGLINVGGLQGLIIKAVVCIAVTTGLLLVIYVKTKSFKKAAAFAKRVLKRG